jgi:copper(I)-binding protein
MTWKKAGLLVILMMAGCGKQESVRITDAWIRETPPGRTVTAAFMTAENLTGQDLSIVRVESAVSDTIELHTMEYAGEMMMMKKVEQIAIPAHGVAALQPGAEHVMLFGLKRAMTAGDSAALIIHLSDGSTIPVNARVKPFTPMSR